MKCFLFHKWEVISAKNGSTYQSTREKTESCLPIDSYTAIVSRCVNCNKIKQKKVDGFHQENIMCFIQERKNDECQK